MLQKEEKKLRVMILCGGQSAEHEVSLNSAKNIINALDLTKYIASVVRIERNGEWRLLKDLHDLSGTGQRATLLLGSKPELLVVEGTENKLPIDVVFPVLHGSNGEDGTMQGLLELANVPFVGPGVLSSAICMDKVISKQLLRSAGILVADWCVLERDEISSARYPAIIEQLGLPLFVKPANIGSSVGISKVHEQEEMADAVELALQYDHKIIFEKNIKGREIECSVLGNQLPRASLPGEIIPQHEHEFYDYDAKYIDPEGALLKVPADLPYAMVERVQSIAIKAFKVLQCVGLARVDFFVTDDSSIYVNELNTLPGFTQISMYPKLWMVSGMSYSQLIDELIALAIEKFQRDNLLSNKLQTSTKTNL